MPRQHFSFMLYFEKLCYFFHHPVPVLREPYLPVGRGEQGLDLQLNLFTWWKNVMWYLKRCLMSCMLFSKVSTFLTCFFGKGTDPTGRAHLGQSPQADWHSCSYARDLRLPAFRDGATIAAASTVAFLGEKLRNPCSNSCFFYYW